MDLLTVLRHELGHVLGLAHAGGLMSPTLSADETCGVSATDATGLEPPAAESYEVERSTDEGDEVASR